MRAEDKKKHERQKRILNLIKEIYPNEDADQPFLLTFQVVRVAEAYAAELKAENDRLKEGVYRVLLHIDLYAVKPSMKVYLESLLSQQQNQPKQ